VADRGPAGGRLGDPAANRARRHAGGTGPDGRPFASGRWSIEVVRRQYDGRWLFVIDVPREENRAPVRPP
jgi:ketosteroid isomerase-like protein